MADINVERKSGLPWLWIILGLILLALLIWWLVPDGEEEPVVATSPMAEIQPPTVGAPPEPVAQGPATSIAAIIESPATWTGQTFAGEVQVGEVVSDRGFWITDQGERLFVVINEAPGPQANEAVRNEPLNIEANQALRIREAIIYTDPARLPGEIEPETRRIAASQPVFLATDAGNINIIGQQR